MAKKIYIEEVIDWNLWDKNVNESEEGTIFHLKQFLDFSKVNYRCWFVKKGLEIIGGVSVQENDNGDKSILDDLIIHNGIWFKPSFNQKKVNIEGRNFKITEKVINMLSQKYKGFQLSLSPQFNDLRPFIWFNYEKTDEERVKLSIRYTSYMDISELRYKFPIEKYEIYKNLKSLRQRNLKEGIRKGAYIKKSNNFDYLLDNLRSTLGISKIKFSKKRKKIYSLMCNLQSSGKGQLYSLHSSCDMILYNIFLGWDEKRAYYLYGAGEKNNKENYRSTCAFWFAFTDLASKKNINEFDWEGVNSPNRGWFKLSFGSKILPYYELSWKNHHFN